MCCKDNRTIKGSHPLELFLSNVSCLAESVRKQKRVNTSKQEEATRSRPFGAVLTEGIETLEKIRVAGKTTRLTQSVLVLWFTEHHNLKPLPDLDDRDSVTVRKIGSKHRSCRTTS